MSPGLLKNIQWSDPTAVDHFVALLAVITPLLSLQTPDVEVIWYGKIWDTPENKTQT